MPPPFCRRSRPPWWPEGEPWPSPMPHQRVRRVRFFRRAAAFVVVMLMLAAWGAASLIWAAATTFGGAASPGQRSIFIVFAGAAAVLGMALVALIASVRRVARPLDAVMDAADRVAAGDYDVRVGEHGPPPFRALARSFNTMTERLQNHDRLRRNLMADVAHELRTPLTVMQGKLEGLVDGVYAPSPAQLQQLLEETHVLSRLVEDLRTLALSESGALKLHKQPVDPADLVRDAVRAYAADAERRGVTLSVDAPDDLPSIEIDPVRIREVITNLLSNALHHTPAGGSVAVRAAADTDGRLSITVRDTGRGMTSAEIARAFDRFYKGTESRGSGLGLTIARSLVAAHGGEIHAESTPGDGTTIAFTVPFDQ